MYLTYEEVWGAVLLQEGVQVVPELRDPVENVEKFLVVSREVPLFVVGLRGFPVQVPQQEPIGWFHVVGECDHPVNTCKKNAPFSYV